MNRISQMIVYFFYKNFVFTIIHFFYGFINDFSGQTIIEDWFISLFNLIFTSIPLAARGILDISLKPEDGIIVQILIPYLYKEQRENPHFNIKNFLLNLLKGIFHSLINYFVGIYTINDLIDKEGHDSNLWVISNVLYTNVLLIVSLDMIIFTQYHTWLNWIIIVCLTFGLYIIFLVMVEHMTVFSSSGTMKTTFNSGLVWMNFILVGGFCSLIDFGILIYKILFVKRIYNSVKLLKNKNDISYEYIKTIPEELQNLLLNNDRVKEFNKDKNIIENIKKENSNKLKEIMNGEEDDTLFYSEKLEKEDDIKAASNWLAEVNNEEIQSNFNSLSEERKNNKNFDYSNLFYFETNYSLPDSDPSSIFDEIPQYGDRYKKFSQYLSDKSYKNYMKKMNYNYLDLMLLNYFDLHLEFQKYNFLQKEMVAMSFIKKFILNSGICNSKIYENIIKIIYTKKGSFNFENYLDCFMPILETKMDKCQTFKYKFLLSLVKNQSTQIVSMENYKVFCNLIKGKSVYEEENCKKLSKNMIESFKNKFPRENVDDFKFFQIMTVIECIIDGDQ